MSSAITRTCDRCRPQVAGSIHVGAVVERVGIARELHPVVAASAAVRTRHAASQDGERQPELVALCVVGEVAGDQHRVGPLRSNRADGGVQHLGGERLLRAERRVQGSAETVEERYARRRLLVANVGVGDDAQRGDRPFLASGSPEIGAVDQRLGRGRAPTRRRRWRRRAWTAASNWGRGIVPHRSRPPGARVRATRAYGASGHASGRRHAARRLRTRPRHG
jgi:hypothetical protein